MDREEFFDSLERYHLERGHAYVPGRLLGQKVDLYDMFIIAMSQGGFPRINKNNKWGYLAKHLGLVPKDKPPSAQDLEQVKRYYVKWIRHFEGEMVPQHVKRDLMPPGMELPPKRSASNQHSQAPSVSSTPSDRQDSQLLGFGGPMTPFGAGAAGPPDDLYSGRTRNERRLAQQLGTPAASGGAIPCGIGGLGGAGMSTAAMEAARRRNKFFRKYAPEAVEERRRKRRRREALIARGLLPPVIDIFRLQQSLEERHFAPADSVFALNVLYHLSKPDRGISVEQHPGLLDQLSSILSESAASTRESLLASLHHPSSSGAFPPDLAGLFVSIFDAAAPAEERVKSLHEPLQPEEVLPQVPPPPKAASFFSPAHLLLPASSSPFSAPSPSCAAGSLHVVHLVAAILGNLLFQAGNVNFLAGMSRQSLQEAATSAANLAVAKSREELSSGNTAGIWEETAQAAVGAASLRTGGMAVGGVRGARAGSSAAGAGAEEGILVFTAGGDEAKEEHAHGGGGEDKKDDEKNKALGGGLDPGGSDEDEEGSDAEAVELEEEILLGTSDKSEIAYTRHGKMFRRLPSSTLFDGGSSFKDNLFASAAMLSGSTPSSSCGIQGSGTPAVGASSASGTLSPPADYQAAALEKERLASFARERTVKGTAASLLSALDCFGVAALAAEKRIALVSNEAAVRLLQAQALGRRLRASTYLPGDNRAGQESPDSYRKEVFEEGKQGNQDKGSTGVSRQRGFSRSDLSEKDLSLDGAIAESGFPACSDESDVRLVLLENAKKAEAALRETRELWNEVGEERGPPLEADPGEAYEAAAGETRETDEPCRLVAAATAEETKELLRLLVEEQQRAALREERSVSAAASFCSSLEGGKREEGVSVRSRRHTNEGPQVDALRVEDDAAAGGQSQRDGRRLGPDRRLPADHGSSDPNGESEGMHFSGLSEFPACDHTGHQGSNPLLPFSVPTSSWRLERVEASRDRVQRQASIACPDNLLSLLAGYGAARRALAVKRLRQKIAVSVGEDTSDGAPRFVLSEDAHLAKASLPSQPGTADSHDEAEETAHPGNREASDASSTAVHASSESGAFSAGQPGDSSSSQSTLGPHLGALVESRASAASQSPSFLSSASSFSSSAHTPANPIVAQEACAPTVGNAEGKPHDGATSFPSPLVPSEGHVPDQAEQQGRAFASASPMFWTKEDSGGGGEGTGIGEVQSLRRSPGVVDTGRVVAAALLGSPVSVTQNILFGAPAVTLERDGDKTFLEPLLHLLPTCRGGEPEQQRLSFCGCPSLTRGGEGRAPVVGPCLSVRDSATHTRGVPSEIAGASEPSEKRAETDSQDREVHKRQRSEEMKESADAAARLGAMGRAAEGRGFFEKARRSAARTAAGEEEINDDQEWLRAPLAVARLEAGGTEFKLTVACTPASAGRQCSSPFSANCLYLAGVADCAPEITLSDKGLSGGGGAMAQPSKGRSVLAQKRRSRGVISSVSRDARLRAGVWDIVRAVQSASEHLDRQQKLARYEEVREILETVLGSPLSTLTLCMQSPQHTAARLVLAIQLITLIEPDQLAKPLANVYEAAVAAAVGHTHVQGGARGDEGDGFGSRRRSGASKSKKLSGSRSSEVELGAEEGPDKSPDREADEGEGGERERDPQELPRQARTLIESREEKRTHLGERREKESTQKDGNDPVVVNEGLAADRHVASGVNGRKEPLPGHSGRDEMKDSASKTEEREQRVREDQQEDYSAIASAVQLAAWEEVKGELERVAPLTETAVACLKAFTALTCLLPRPPSPVLFSFVSRYRHAPQNSWMGVAFVSAVARIFRGLQSVSHTTIPRVLQSASGLHFLQAVAEFGSQMLLFRQTAMYAHLEVFLSVAAALLDFEVSFPSLQLPHILVKAALALFYLSADGPALALREVFEAVAEEHDRKSAEEAVDRIDRSSSLLGTPRKSQEDAQGEDFADGVETESGGDSDGGDDDDTGDEERADNAAASGPERKCSPTNTALQGRGGASYQGDRGSVKEAAGESGKDGEGAAAREEAGDSGAFESASPYSRRRLKKKGPSPGAIEVAARLFVGPLLRFLRFRMQRSIRLRSECEIADALAPCTAVHDAEANRLLVSASCPTPFSTVIPHHPVFSAAGSATLLADRCRGGWAYAHFIGAIKEMPLDPALWGKRPENVPSAAQQRRSTSLEKPHATAATPYSSALPRDGYGKEPQTGHLIKDERKLGVSSHHTAPNGDDTATRADCVEWETKTMSVAEDVANGPTRNARDGDPQTRRVQAKKERTHNEMVLAEAALAGAAASFPPTAFHVQGNCYETSQAHHLHPGDVKGCLRPCVPDPTASLRADIRALESQRATSTGGEGSELVGVHAIFMMGQDEELTTGNSSLSASPVIMEQASRDRQMYLFNKAGKKKGCFPPRQQNECLAAHASSSSSDCLENLSEEGLDEEARERRVGGGGLERGPGHREGFFQVSSANELNSYHNGRAGGHAVCGLSERGGEGAFAQEERENRLTRSENFSGRGGGREEQTVAIDNGTGGAGEQEEDAEEPWQRPRVYFEQTESHQAPVPFSPSEDTSTPQDSPSPNPAHPHRMQAGQQQQQHQAGEPAEYARRMQQQHMQYQQGQATAQMQYPAGQVQPQHVAGAQQPSHLLQYPPHSLQQPSQPQQQQPTQQLQYGQPVQYVGASVHSQDAQLQQQRQQQQQQHPQHQVHYSQQLQHNAYMQQQKKLSQQEQHQQQVHYAHSHQGDPQQHQAASQHQLGQNQRGQQGHEPSRDCSAQHDSQRNPEGVQTGQPLQHQQQQQQPQPHQQGVASWPSSVQMQAPPHQGVMAQSPYLPNSWGHHPGGGDAAGAATAWSAAAAAAAAAHSYYQQHGNWQGSQAPFYQHSAQTQWGANVGGWPAPQEWEQQQTAWGAAAQQAGGMDAGAHMMGPSHGQNNYMNMSEVQWQHQQWLQQQQQWQQQMQATGGVNPATFWGSSGTGIEFQTDFGSAASSSAPQNMQAVMGNPPGSMQHPQQQSGWGLMPPAAHRQGGSENHQQQQQQQTDVMAASQQVAGARRTDANPQGRYGGSSSIGMSASRPDRAGGTPGQHHGQEPGAKAPFSASQFYGQHQGQGQAAGSSQQTSASHQNEPLSSWQTGEAAPPASQSKTAEGGQSPVGGSAGGKASKTSPGEAGGGGSKKSRTKKDGNKAGGGEHAGAISAVFGDEETTVEDDVRVAVAALCMLAGDAFTLPFLRPHLPALVELAWYKTSVRQPLFSIIEELLAGMRDSPVMHLAGFRHGPGYFPSVKEECERLKKEGSSGIASDPRKAEKPKKRADEEKNLARQKRIQEGLSEFGASRDLLWVRKVGQAGKRLEVSETLELRG